MPHAEHTVTIARPPQDVFDYLADGTHNRDWREGVLEISRTSAGDGPGATYRQVLAGPGGSTGDVVRRVRARYPNVPLQVDANSAYTLDDIATLQRLDAFNLLLIDDEFSTLAEELDNLQEKFQVSFVISAGNYVTPPLLSANAGLKIG